MPVLVNNMQEAVEVPRALLSLLKEIGEFILRLEGRSLDCEVSVILVDNSYIQDLNLTYRGLDAPTDVLSFNLQDDVTDFEADSILGDVVVSLEKAAEQAAAYRHSLKREVAFLTLHGILHLLGYDHETPEEEREMNEKAELVLKKYKI
ncbi:MAG TPA: rRNA maturation RNase YbeY [Firmicutes bacterium]|jgi:probable rRNA maturation factor|nr:rRNA maturation RNase YbeY [Bacillota bacterium]